MARTVWSRVWALPTLLGTVTLVSAAASATEVPSATDLAVQHNRILNEVANYSNSDSGGSTEQDQDQVTSVSQLSDVRPTDWAFQALQSLVERYGCIVGYPDKTYRGNRALSRYEFAAGVNACLDRINELLAAATADLVKKEDLAALQKLQEEFAAELAALRGRVDVLEARTATLEKQQFSTTTKLQGEVILSVASPFGDDRALNSDQWRTINNTPAGPRREAARAAAFGTAGRGLKDNAIFSDRARINLITSFTGKDRLYTRLEANNTTAFNNPITGTNQTRLAYDNTTTLDNSVQLGKTYYSFPVGDNLNIIVDAIGGEFFTNFYTFNPYFENPATGSVSRFGRFSPIYRSSNSGSGNNTGAGVSVNLKLGPLFTFSAGYLARRPYDPAEGRGLFDGTYAALAQLAFQPSKDFAIGLTYSRAYYSGAANDVSVSGAYGSAFANQPFGAGLGNTALNPRGVATSANHYGVEANYRIFPGFAISAWGLYTQAIAEDGSGIAAVNTGDKADIWSWAVGLAFPDLFKKGNLGGIIFGQTPRVTSNDYGPPVLGLTTARREDNDTSFHVEALYRLQVTNNISVTPGFFVIFNPENNSNNDTVYVGVLRTTFRF
jgi:hypothetical protein